LSYVDELAGELRRVGIRGRLERRILAEIADHLASDPAAALGPPDELARGFADELGTSRSRRAAFAAFGALTLAGVAYTIAFVAISVANVRIPLLDARSRPIADVAFATAVGAPQLAFVAGVLAALRAFRRRRDASLPAAEARVLVRRTGTALGAGLATMAAVAVVAYEYAPHLSAWLQSTSYACAAIGGAALLAAAPAAVAATRVHVTASGEPTDVFADLGPLVPLQLRGRPWTFAAAVAAIVCVTITAAGILQSDPFDGAMRGVLDAVAVLAGFAVLGRFLGLRRR